MTREEMNVHLMTEGNEILAIVVASTKTARTSDGA
jgi:hypothetical protein